jgi:outer membrane biosynthesis protein TonB
VAPLQITPGEERPEAPTEEATTGTPGQPRARGGRYSNLDQHELITLLDEVDDERAKARFREAVYIALIFWLVFGWAIVYAPRYFWHPPVIVEAPDEKRPTTMTYLDTPPNLQKQLKQMRPTPNISSQNSQAQSPKPSPKAPEPRAGNPTPAAPQPRPAPAPPQQAPAPAPQPQQQPQQQARNTPPTPAPPHPTPQPLADAPSATPQPNRSIFGGQQSAGEAIAGAARSSRNSGGGESGDYGSTGRGSLGGAKEGYQILSDTQGVDFGKYIARLLADIRRNWLPLIPEECRPPLNKQGITGVRFTIQPNGAISAMHLDYSTHDVAIDRAAWGSITALGAAQPLPKEFHGPNLELRIEFRVNKDGPDAQ